MSNSVNESAIKKLKLLFTVVDRTKGEFYLDVISQFEVNSQLLMGQRVNFKPLSSKPSKYLVSLSGV